MVGTKRHSTSVNGIYHTVKLPVIRISEKPYFPEGAKTKILDENGNVIFDGEKQSTINRLFCLEEHLTEAIKELHNNGIQIAETTHLTTILPIKCPICDNEGDPVFQLDNRKKNEKWVKRDTPIRIYYYHGYGKGKHYVGTWKNGTTLRSPKVTDIRKMSPFSSLNMKRN